MEKMDIFEIRKGRGGGDGYFWRLQTDGIDSNGRKSYLTDNIPRRAWLIIQKERVQNKKSMCQTDDGRKMKDLARYKYFLASNAQQKIQIFIRNLKFLFYVLLTAAKTMNTASHSLLTSMISKKNMMLFRYVPSLLQD